MITIHVKRKMGNNSCVHGILSIPQYDFKCMTLELKASDNLNFKMDCALPLGQYEMKRGYSQGYPFFPILKRKPNGFPVKPKFNMKECKYNELPTGDIALGTAPDGDFAIRHSEALERAFADLWEDIFVKHPDPIIVLNIYKSKNYVHTEMSYEDVLKDEANRVFLEDIADDEDEFVELEND